MATLEFGKLDVYAMVLQSVDSPAEYDLRGVLNPLESAIRAAAARNERYAEIDDHEAELMIDDECGYVEDLLGAAFVMTTRAYCRFSRVLVVVSAGLGCGGGGPEMC